MNPWMEIELERGRTVQPDTGLLGVEEGCWVNFEPVPVRAGDALAWRAPGFEYQLFFYLPDIVPELIHTYAYQPESNWTTYAAELSELRWSRAAHRFTRAGYFRVAMRRAEGAEHAPAPRRLADAAELTQSDSRGAREDSPWIQEEADAVCLRAERLRGDADFTALLLTDTHCATGCNWPDTLASLRLCGARIRPDAAIHLGDLTDGILPLRHTQRFARRVMDGLKSLGIPLYICIGNHDANYFRGNREFLSDRQCGEFYLNRRETSYFADWPEHRLRAVFLNSFDPARKERYGFSFRDLLRMRRALITLPRGWRVLVFSHVPPLAKLHVWSDTIRNGDRMLRMLERFDRRRGGAVLGWIHGHNHADQVCRDLRFPIIAVGCGKTEDFEEHKPEGSHTPPRQPGTRTQELWDVLIVRRDGSGLEFVRFGAGEDRSISVAKD